MLDDIVRFINPCVKMSFHSINPKSEKGSKKSIIGSLVDKEIVAHFDPSLSIDDCVGAFKQVSRNILLSVAKVD